MKISSINVMHESHCHALKDLSYCPKILLPNVNSMEMLEIRPQVNFELSTSNIKLRADIQVR